MVQLYLFPDKKYSPKEFDRLHSSKQYCLLI